MRNLDFWAIAWYTHGVDSDISYTMNGYTNECAKFIF